MQQKSDNNPIYKERVLAFVDILGFKEMVVKSAHNIDEQNRIKTAINIIQEFKQMNDGGPIGGLQEYDVQVTTFSDSAIISYPLALDGSLFCTLINLTHMQIALLNLGIFIRGGVSIGQAFHDGTNAFGPAMIEAYMLESTIAKYPRIILTEQTVKKYFESPSAHTDEHDTQLFYDLLRKDYDGYYHLNYLRQHDELNHPEETYYDWLRKIRTALLENLNSSYQQKSNVFWKYHWFLNYWNSIFDPDTISIPLPMGTNALEKKDIKNSYLQLQISDGYPYK